MYHCKKDQIPVSVFPFNLYNNTEESKSKSNRSTIDQGRHLKMFENSCSKLFTCYMAVLELGQMQRCLVFITRNLQITMLATMVFFSNFNFSLGLTIVKCFYF